MSDARYADELFPEKEQFADDLFPASVDTENARKKLGASPIQDYIFSRDKTSVARTLSHFGQGFGEAWGAEPLGLSEKSQKYLRESGWFNDYSAGQSSIAKAANEAIFRPAAMVLDAGWRTLGGVMRGTQEAIAGTGEDLGQKRLGRDLAATIEAFPHPRPFVGTTGIPQVAGPLAQSGETLLLRARAAKIIGHGEEGWRGTAPEVAETRAAPRVPVEIPEGQSAIEQTFATARDEPAAPQSEVANVARGIAPDLFTRYDEAQAKRSQASAEYNELQGMRAANDAQAAEIASLKAKLQEQIKAAETETRELSPAVKEAYAEAKKVTTPEPDVTTPAKDVGKDSVIPPENVTTRTDNVTTQARPVEEQRAFIQQDIAQKLMAAGRPEAEAQASAAIDAAYWETRAARFNGAKGTAEEMYRREAPEILGPGMQSDFRTARKPTTQNVSLGQFVSSIGIRDNDPLIGDVKSLTGGGRKYIRKDGVPLDTLREQAVEAGYIPEKSTVRTLLDALAAEDKGRKVFKAGEEAPEAFNRDSHLNAIEKALDDGLRDVGLDPKSVPDEVRARAIEILDKEGVSDPIAAYERAEGEAGMFQKDAAPAFYSSVLRSVEASKQGKASADQWLGTIRNSVGVKPEEMQWLGLEQWLKQQKGSVTKEQVADYVRANAIEVKEVTKGGNVPPEAVAAMEKWLTKDVGSEATAMAEAMGHGEASAISHAETLGAPAELLQPFYDSINGGATKFKSYTLPGGENYRELLLTLPNRASGEMRVAGSDAANMARSLREKYGERYLTEAPAAELKEYERVYQRAAGDGKQNDLYRSSHFEETNVLAHVRFNDRVIDGKKTLFIEEVQSDWHQAGKKKGYKQPDREEPTGKWRVTQTNPDGSTVPYEFDTKAEAEAWAPRVRDAGRDAVVEPATRTVQSPHSAVPDAPFKTTWPELSMKRMIRYAAENGYDKIAWTPGEVQAARYDLSKQISRVQYVGDVINAWDKDGKKAFSKVGVKPEELPDYIGKDAAEKLLAQKPKEIERLSHVKRDELTVHQTEHQYIVRNKDGREVPIGKGTVGSEADALDYAERYFNKSADEINQKRELAGERTGPSRELSGMDLKVGGEGMLGFYDDILPTTVNKLVKKYGVRVKNEDMLVPQSKEAPIADKPKQVHALDISEQLRDAATEQGFPLFQGGDTIKRGRIRLREDGRNTITLLKDANASTFIHEKGHDYLARLIRDSGDELASPQLRADTEAVYRWLGVDKPSEIKTSHHEKFARGFENYVMEGRAPTHALARVFEQFRQWLVRIYTEASRLKAPINDEIRGVFDRMLALNPEEVVIAPDRAPERMAARHEAATVAPFGEADDAARAVHAERDTMAGRLAPEEQDARLAEIAARLEGRAPRGAEPLRDGNAPEPAAGGGGADPGAGALGEGGGAIAPEGNQAPQGQNVKPVRPTDPFGPSTVIADKAGNIRLDLLKAPDDVKSIISQVAEENEGFQRVRGPVTDVQVAELAEAMGMDATYLSTRKMGEAWTAPQIVALRNLLIQSATEVRDLMKKAANGGEAELLAYAEAKARHMMIQERVSSVTAEAGRALRAFQRRFSAGMDDARSLGDFLKKDTGQTLFQLQREAQLGASLESPAQVSKFIHDSRKATVSEMIQETWINALLSGPLTHVKNVIGNTVTAVMGAGETAVASGVGKVRAILGNDGERIKANEVQANLFGLLQGAQDGIIAAKYAFLHEEQYTRAQTLEQGKFQAVPSKRVVLARYEIGSPEYNARMDSIANARARAERLTDEALTNRVAKLKADPTPDMVLEAREKAVELGGKQVRLPGRFLTAEDEFFKTVAYRQKLNELAYREASKSGLSGDAFNTKVAQLTMNPPEEMMTAASKHADYQTFTNALGKTGTALQMFANSHILAKMVVPFVRTPLNLLKYASERTPLGVFSREVRANLAGTNGKIAQDTQIARIAIGTSLAVAVMKMADDGTITGGGPSDKNERAVLMLSGWRPYSVKIGEHYYSYAWLDPFSTIMGIAADMGDAAKKLGSEGDEELAKVATNLFASISKNVLSKASLRGASDLMQAATDPDRWGAKYLQQLAGTVVPSVVAQRARANDEFQREARTIVDNLKSRIPGLRQDLLPKRDIWGEPIRAGESLGPDSLSPVALSKLTKDQATQALIDAELFPAKLDRKIRGVELTDQQYDDFSRVAGRMAKMRVNAIISNPGFENTPIEIRSELLRKTINGSRDAARSMILMQNPSIIQQAIQNKMSAVGR